jgi:hypothetical protein
MPVIPLVDLAVVRSGDGDAARWVGAAVAVASDCFDWTAGDSGDKAPREVDVIYACEVKMHDRSNQRDERHWPGQRSARRSARPYTAATTRAGLRPIDRQLIRVRCTVHAIDASRTSRTRTRAGGLGLRSGLWDAPESGGTALAEGNAQNMGDGFESTALGDGFDSTALCLAHPA